VQKDRDAPWTVKFTKAKPQADGTIPPVDIAIPAFGYQNHIAIDREHGLIRRWLVTDASAYEGARLREGLLDPTNTSKAVWADTPTAPRPKRPSSTSTASSARYIARSPRADPCRRRRGTPTTRNRRSALASSMSSRSRR